ncbi:MAG: DUF459 domain-containing protein [Deltaproteobacteria bacterium]|nr:DUF459 domain-containing protein [Deltaproteobacteria bacterium]
MRFKRKGLSPTKILVIYILAFFLILVHEADRFATWLEDLGRAGNSYPFVIVLNFAADLSAFTHNVGLVKLKDYESRFFAALTPQTLVGNFPRQPIPALPKRTFVPDPVPLGPVPGLPPYPATTNEPEDTSSSLRLDKLSPADAIPLLTTNLPSSYRNILIVGDSFMVEGLGPMLERSLLEIPDLQVKRVFKSATGLSRDDYFDWPKFLQTLLEENLPELIIISLGANDAQDIVTEERKRHHVNTPGWNEIYSNRVRQILDMATSKGVAVFWIGLPIMGKIPYNNNIQNINALVAQTCEEYVKCHFFNSSKLLADPEGNFTAYLTMPDGSHKRIRAKDSVHLTEFGGQILVQAFFEVAGSWGLYGIPELLPKNKNPLNLQALGIDMADISPESQELTKDESLLLAILFSSQTPSNDSDTPDSASSDSDTPDSASSNSASSDSTSSDSAISDFATSLRKNFLETLDRTRIIDPNLSRESESTPGQPRPLIPLKLPLPQGPKPKNPATLVEVNFSSKARSKDTNYLIYLPDPEKTRPTVILLHGPEENHLVFKERFGWNLLELSETLDINLVMPDGDPYGWYLDSPYKKNSRLERYLIQELIPDLIARFRIDPNQLGILGISMGGHGALTLALKNPTTFKIVGSISGIVDLGIHTGFFPEDQNWRISEVLGPPQGNLWRNHSAYYLTKDNPQIFENIPLFLTVGKLDEVALGENRQYHRLLNDLGIFHTYSEEKGGHSWDLWETLLPRVLTNLATTFPRT